MIFNAPVDPQRALKSTAVKELMPTSMSSDELAGLSRTLRERSRFSARTLNASHLQTIHDTIDEILAPKLGKRGAIEGIDYATARLRLKDSLTRIGYSPAGRIAGTIQDLGSDARLNLIIKTNVDMARGFGFWKAGQEPGAIDLFPCSELYRRESRVEPRDWPTRWKDMGGVIYNGRMIARKDSPIWMRISRFGLPYPPFDFNSGMWIQDVEYDEAVALGVIAEGDSIEPKKRPFEDREAAAPTDPKLLKSLMKTLGPEYGVTGGTVRAVPAGPVEIKSTPARKAYGGKMVSGLVGDEQHVSWELSEEDKKAGRILIAADVSRLEKAWKASAGEKHLGKWKEDAAFRRGAIRRSIASRAVTAPRVSMPSANSPTLRIEKGRHTFAEARDAGLEAIPIAVPEKEAHIWIQKYGHSGSDSTVLGISAPTPRELKLRQLEIARKKAAQLRTLAKARAKLAAKRKAGLVVTGKEVEKRKKEIEKAVAEGNKKRAAELAAKEKARLEAEKKLAAEKEAERKRKEAEAEKKRKEAVAKRARDAARRSKWDDKPKLRLGRSTGRWVYVDKIDDEDREREINRKVAEMKKSQAIRVAFGSKKRTPAEMKAEAERQIKAREEKAKAHIESVKRSEKSLRKVMNTNKLPGLAVRPMPEVDRDGSDLSNTYGQFWPVYDRTDAAGTHRWRGSKIVFNPTTAMHQTSLTFAHENGHHLDLLLGNGRYLSEQSAANVPASFLKIFQRAKKSEAVQKLEARKKASPSRWLKYATSRLEIFARAFSQYIAVRAEDAEALDGARRRAPSFGGYSDGAQWDPEDFEPIAEAFDDFFYEEGLLDSRYEKKVEKRRAAKANKR